MKRFTLSALSILLAASIFTAKATRSVGYKLWDSNNGYTATLVPSNLTAIQLNHIQIKFDDAITIVASEEDLSNQLSINMASNRTVNFSVNELDKSILDITLTGDGTAQASSVLTVKAADESGVIPGITDSKGNAVTLIPISSIQPTGLALEVVSSTVGTASAPASVTYKMSSIPLVRSMNFLQAQSNKCDNPDGYLAREYFTIHSHNYSAMTANTHFTTLTGTANVDTLLDAGYNLELIDGDDDDNPYIKLTALAPSVGEKLAWIVYHYPYRAAADRKFELAQLIETSQASQELIEAAKTVLYDDDATAYEVLAAINSLDSSNGIILPKDASQWTAIGGSRSVTLRGLTPGSIITVYSISGKIAANLSVTYDTKTISLPSGIYIVRVNDSAKKVLVK
ncbi:MAG: T9SS type A sorting domain-containing protein [Tannerella sp.]|nr:T9SS type A sorting domain-containing protein [Tannerella sp.]